MGHTTNAEDPSDTEGEVEGATTDLEGADEGPVRRILELTRDGIWTAMGGEQLSPLTSTRLYLDQLDALDAACSNTPLGCRRYPSRCSACTDPRVVLQRHLNQLAHQHSLQWSEMVLRVTQFRDNTPAKVEVVDRTDGRSWKVVFEEVGVDIDRLEGALSGSLAKAAEERRRTLSSPSLVRGDDRGMSR